MSQLLAWFCKSREGQTPSGLSVCMFVCVCRADQMLVNRVILET